MTRLDGDVKLLGHRALDPQLALSDVQTSENLGETVVEIMRQAAGETTYGLESLGLQKLRLEFSTHRDVFQTADDLPALELLVNTDEHPMRSTILIHETDHGLRLDSLRRIGGPTENFRPACAILLEDMSRHRGPERLLGRQSQTRIPCLVEKQDLLFQVDPKDHIGNEGKNLVGASLRLSKLLDQPVLKFDVEILTLERS